jgi:hypothetical protein
MVLSKLWLKLVWGVFAGFVFVLSPVDHVIRAQENVSPPLYTTIPVLEFEQRDLDNDGTPDLGIIDSQYVLTDTNEALDRVFIYDQADNMQWSTDWYSGTDFEDDMWLFKPNGTDFARLIIHFHVEDGLHIADFYHDDNNDRVVQYSLAANSIIDILEADTPALRLFSRGPWVLPNGLPNINLRWEVYRVADAERSLGGRTIFPQNGRLNSQGELVDQDGDGIIDYELGQSFPNLPFDWLYPRTGLNVYEDNTQFTYQNAAFFPYLGSIRQTPWEGSQSLRSPGDPIPPIMVEWELGKIRAIASFMPLWGGDRLRFNSYTQLERNEENVLYFERFGHFSFSGTDDPDLIIRWDLSHSPNHQVETDPDLFQVQISWHRPDDVGTLLWDYKLELAGLRPAPESVIQFADFGVREVPLALWPSWFTEQTWAFGSLIDTEGTSYATNETVYEWNSIEGTVINVTTGEEVAGARDGQASYLLGNITETPARFYTQLRPGFRGEYADLLNTHALMYFSPIDRKLHLRGSTQGVWNLGYEREIRYANLGGDYLNHWMERTGETITSELYAVPNFLLYNGIEGVYIRRAAYEPVLFTTLHPRTREEWLAFDAALTEHERDFAPDDFLRMLEQFNGTTAIFERATVSDVRLLENGGFRFSLHLRATTHAQSDDAIFSPMTSLIAPGNYEVIWTGNAFAVQPLTAPDLQITRFEASPADNSPDLTSLHPVRVSFTLANAGLQDLHNVQVRLFATRTNPLPSTTASSVRPEPIFTQIIQLEGETSEALEYIWAPPQPGEWALHLDAVTQAGDYISNANLTTQQTLTLVLNSVPPTDLLTLLSLGGEHPFRGILVVALALSLAFSSAMLVLVIIRYESASE